MELANTDVSVSLVLPAPKTSHEHANTKTSTQPHRPNNEMNTTIMVLWPTHLCFQAQLRFKLSTIIT